MAHRAVLLTLLLTWSPAHADRTSAARFFSAGQQAFEKGDYLTAIRAFGLSERAKPHPSTAFALAQSLQNQAEKDRDVAKVQRAVDLYRQFL